jgi:hypothetical protein
MSALFNQAARQERERFFFRLDSQWGKGLRQKTKSDRCPDFRVISKPNIISEWAVYSFGDKGIVYESATKRQSRDWLLAVLTLYPLAHLELKALAQRSKQTSVLSLPRTSEARLSCDAQTLTTSHRAALSRDVRHVGLGTFSDAPSASSLVPDFSGDVNRVEAPYRIIDGRKVWLP